MALPQRSNSPGNALAHAYFKESRLPVYSAALVLPFLIVYEAGIALLRSDVINGGDAIVINVAGPVFHRLGVSGGVISLIFLVAFFLIWQYSSRASLKLKPPVLLAMFFESLFYAVLLFLMLQFLVHYMVEDAPIRRAHAELRAPLAECTTPVVCARPAPAGKFQMRDFVLYCGAGVFEEFVFRALLLGLLVLVLTRLFYMEHAWAAAWSVLLGAAIFSAFHHIGGERFEPSVFTQRLIAGIYFSALFYNRSFGVAAASHALYDIVVGLNQLRQ